MRKRLAIIMLVLSCLLLASGIKAAFKYLSESNRKAQKVLVTPQVIRFEDGSTDEAEFSPRPSVKAQLNRQCQEIVICGTPSVLELNGINCRTTTVELVERIVDARYLSGKGNLLDTLRLRFRPDLGKGEQILLSIYEFGNCLCLGAYTSLLACKEIASGRGCRRREQFILVQEMTRDVIEDAEFSETSRAEYVSRQIEQRPWYKPDIYHDKRELCTTEQRERATVLMVKRTKIHATCYDLSSEGWLGSPEVRTQSATTNIGAKVLVVRQKLGRTNKWTESEKSYRGCKRLLGRGFTVSDKDVAESESIICTDYVFDRTVPDLGSPQTIAELERELACLESFRTRKIVLDPIIQNYSELISEDKFEDGAITYLTGGSIANLFIKTDLGYELAVMDWVWAGVDVASIAITAATWGSGGAVTMAGKTVAMVAVKQGTKLAIRATAKAAVKTSTRATTRAIMRRMVKTAGTEVAIDGMLLAGGELCQSNAEGDGEDSYGTFRELPEEWLNGTADLNNIPNASYVFPNGCEKSFRTDANGIKL